MKTRNLLSIAVLAALGTAPAMAADEHTGFYFGAGVGQVNVEIPVMPGVLFDNSARIWKGFAGWEFSEHFALEGAYLDADSIDHNFGHGVRGTVDGEILQVSAIGTYWFNDTVSVHGRVSNNWYDSRSEISNGIVTLAANDSGNDMGFGAGIGANVDRALVRLDYEQADLADSETRLVTLSIAWRL